MERATESPQPNIAVIVPPVVCHNLDPHTGIPFMPHIAAYLASALLDAGYRIQVIDCFGLQPNYRQIIQEFMLMGVTEEWVANHLKPETAICYIYCRTIAEFIAVERLIDAIKKRNPAIKICLFENIHAVTSYSLRHVADEFIKKGCDLVIFGDPEDRVGKITECLIEEKSMENIAGIAYEYNGILSIQEKGPIKNDISSLTFPAWECFPLNGYWTAGFAHAPCGKKRFLPLLTSRGCPYRCHFCIAPDVNSVWRGRTAQNVVDEMEYFYRTMQVSDFHISDLNPTVDDKRIKEICFEIMNRRLPVTWKLAQGTKIETIKSDETLELMAKAGCKYISFSPESGSPRLLKIMNKRFDHEYALQKVKKMNELGIKSQAVFLAGVPGENNEDRKQSIKYAKKLIAAGLDEVSLVIFTPLPGAVLSKELNDFHHYSQCTPSPSWRKDYRILSAYRRRMYIMYFMHKLRFPLKVIREFYGFLSHNFETKMEMSLFKQIKLYLLYFVPKLFPKYDSEKMLLKAMANKR